MESEQRFLRVKKDYVPALLLLLVLLVAAGFRFYQLDWDSEMNAYPHPDERHLANTMAHVSLPWPPDWSNLADSDVSTMNPRRINPDDASGAHYDLAYGTLPVYLYRGMTRLIVGKTGQYDSYYIVGRTITALLSLLTVLLAYLIGEKLFGRRVGLLAGALLAASVTHIQLSHFMTVDVALTAFAAVTLYVGLQLVRKRGWWRALLMGLLVGCAASCKVSGLTLGAAIAGAGILVALVPDVRGRRTPLPRVILYMVLAGLGVVLAFGLFEFYAVLDPETYLDAIGSQAEMVSGEVDWPFTRQYINTTPYLYHLKNLARWGLGWPLFVAALAGMLGTIGYLLYVAIRRPGSASEAPWIAGVVQSLAGKPARWGLLLLLFWSLPYFIIVGRYTVKFVRYMVPLAPIFCLAAAWLVWAIADWLGKKAGNWRASERGEEILSRFGAARWTEAGALKKIVAGVVIAVVLIPTLLWALAFMRIYREPHTWYQASLWLYENAPNGSVISQEVWDDSLPVSLPAENENRGMHGFGSASMSPYHDMSPEDKLQHIMGVLEDADYIVLATPRLYGAVRRLPWRYPVEIRYYELLFQEKLGFELAYSATSYPGLWGKVFLDDDADESFSVYDHPKVLIYEKTRQLSEGAYRQLFGDVLNATPMVRRDLDEPPVELPVPEYQKPLMLDTPVDELPAVNDWAWNGLANSGTAPAVLCWLLALLIIGVASYPIAAALFPTFPAHGALLARTLGLLLVAYLTWLPVSLGLWHYTVWAVVAAIVLLVGISWAVARWRMIDLRAIWRSHRKSILTAEAVFLAGFLVFLAIRIWNPDLWHPARGGEKPMEVGFLNAILRSPTMPPYDPFFSDGYINYYYYGLFIVSTLIKLTGIRSSMAFNLIIPTLAALTISGAFAVVWRLTGRRMMGVLGALFTAVIGNLAGAGQIRGRGGLGEALDAMRQLADPTLRDGLAGVFQGLGRWIGGQTLPLRTDWFWDASRAHGAYENTITEFPFFSFLFADLHPHLISLPFAILLIAVCLSLVQSARRPAGVAVPLSLTLPMLALGLGTLMVNNSWDFPVYLLVVGGAIFLAHGVYRQAKGQLPAAWRGLLYGACGALLLGGIGLLLYAPFFTYFKAFVRGLGITTYPTEVSSYLGVFGFFLWPLMVLLLGMAGLWGYRAWRRAGSVQEEAIEEAPVDVAVPTAMPDDVFVGRGSLYLEEDDDEYDEVEMAPVYAPEAPLIAPSPAQPRRRWMPAWRSDVGVVATIGLLIPVLVILVLPALYESLNGRQMLTFVLLGELILGVAVLLLRKELSDELRFVALLMLVGLLVSIGVEFVYVKDHLGGTWYRMNTIFKFYIQVWVLFAIGAAGLVWQVARRLRQRHGVIAGVWWTLFGVLLAAVLVYPVFGTYSRVNDRFSAPPARGTLDGQTYMLTANYTWEGHPIAMAPDYQAMRWMEENLEGTPVVLQAAWEFYRANGVRIAWNTGYPTVLNPLHEDEQRYSAQKSEREQDVYRFYNDADPATVLPLLSKYHIGYVYIGPFERAAYSPEGIAKFDVLAGDVLNLIYDNGEVQIYQVTEEARTAGGVSSSAPMSIPTVSPMEIEARTEAELERLRAMADANEADAGLQFDLGNRLRQAGRHEEAAEIFERSLAHHPEDVAMYQTLGDTYQEMGRMDDALVQYQAAAEVAPNNPAVHNKLGAAYRDRMRYDEAAASFRRAIEVDPNFAEAYFHLGQTLELAGDVSDAGDVYQQLVELHPESDWAARAAERLRALTSGTE